MAKDTFYERFLGVLAELEISPEDAASAMGVKIDTIRRLSDGRTRQPKLDEALRLCEKYGVDPWRLAFGRPAGSESRLPEGPTSHAIQLLRGEIAEVLAVARKAQKTAEEAKTLARRRGSKTA